MTCKAYVMRREGGFWRVFRFGGMIGRFDLNRKIKAFSGVFTRSLSIYGTRAGVYRARNDVRGAFSGAFLLRAGFYPSPILCGRFQGFSGHEKSP